MHRSGLVVMAAVALSACGRSALIDTEDGVDRASSSSHGDSGSGSSSAGRVAANHRASDAQCGLQVPAGDCMEGTGSACQNDSQCSGTGVNGRCITRVGNVAGCVCTSDTCSDDSACSTGQTCACHGSPYTFGTGNTCVPGGCRVDSDCGTDGYCSPSFDTSSCGGLAGYYCHTPKDQCVDDTDCSGSQLQGFCVFSSGDGFWKCQSWGPCH